MTQASASPAAAVQVCPTCDSGKYRILFPATDRLYHTTLEVFQVVECRSCGLRRLYPQPSEKELPAYYPENYWFSDEQNIAGRLEETYRRLVLRDHLGFVRHALRDSGETGFILDVGCGGGLFLEMLRESAGKRVIGLDISASAAGIAWHRYGVPALCGNVVAAPLLTGSCAAVTMFHVLEHLLNPQAHLAAVRNLLRPNGRLIVQVPNAASWQFLLLRKNWCGIDAPRHLVHYRLRDLEKLLNRCGFEVLRRKHFSLRDNPAALATSLAPWLDPMVRRAHSGESSWVRILGNLCYLTLVMASVPFAALEAACRAGATVMVEARKK